MGGEKVRLTTRLGPSRSSSVVLGHDLTHEDHHVVHQFPVGQHDGASDDNDPITADPAVGGPAPLPG